MTAQMVEPNNRARPDTTTPLTARYHRSEPSLDRDPGAEPATIPPTRRFDEPERMSLRTDLFLISHDDNTGQPHLDKQTIAAGLAGAVLLELWNARRVRLGWHGNPHHHTWKRNHGQITLVDASATGDPIHDTAIALLYRLGGTVDTRQFIHQFATVDLYHQVRDHLVATGILRAVTERRFWIFRTTIHRPARATYPVRARARVRNVASLHNPHPQHIALAALVTAIHLTPYLYITDWSTGGIHLRLTELIKPEHPLRHIARTIRPHHHTYT